MKIRFFLLIALLPFISYSQNTEILSKQFDLAIEQENYDDVIATGNKLLIELNRNNVVDGEDVAYIYLNMGYCYNMRKEHAKAVQCLLRACPYYEGESIYHNILLMIAMNYVDLRDFENADIYFKKDLNELQRIGASNTIDYYISLGTMAQVISILGDKEKAISIFPDALKGYKKCLGENSGLYISGLGTMAGFYSSVGNVTESIKLYNEQLMIIEKYDSPFSESYGKALSDQALNYYTIGNYQEAINLFLKSFHCVDASWKYTVASILSVCLCEIGDYSMALAYAQESLKYNEKQYGTNSLQYALSLQSIAYVKYRQGFYDEALEYYNEFYNFVSDEKVEIPNDRVLYAVSGLVSMSACKVFLNDNDSAIDFLLKASNLLNKEKESYHVYESQITIANNLGHFYRNKGDINKALSFHHMAYDIVEKIGYRHRHLVETEYSLATDYMYKGDYQKAYNYFNDAMKLDVEDIFYQLSQMTSNYRALYWEQRNYMIQKVLPYLALRNNTPLLLQQLYDKSALLSKGLLLSAEVEWRKIILESGDSAALDKYSQLQSARMQLNRLYEQPIAERRLSTDSLEQVADRLEQELVQMSKVYGDFMRNLRLTWRDVQQSLDERDIAIEFLSFPVYDTDSTMYIALTVKKGYDSPHMVTLFEEHELESATASPYTSRGLSRLVWGRLAGELEGVEKIHFSASGELYNLAIESVPHWENDYMMSDRYSLYRLSSTRELALSRSETSSSGAVVYGGIRYDTEVSAMGTPSSAGEPLYAYRGLEFDPDSTSYRGGSWSYLKGTLEEADAVTSILRQSIAPVSELTDRAATETTVKALSGQKKSLLHIATHGFYWSEPLAERARKMETLRFLQAGDSDRPRYIEDKAMTRTGLLFSGAQNTFDGVEIPAGVDDGVLTAQEIAHLDLRGLDLLVLSACQTGLGEVSGEGVFGLQRGFKKAGAQTIMMSLWKVSDAATRDMMEQFYRSLTAGMSKRESFLKAQQYVKDHDADYPYDTRSNDGTRTNDSSGSQCTRRPHWAAFILLDALK